MFCHLQLCTDLLASQTSSPSPCWIPEANQGTDYTPILDQLFEGREQISIWDFLARLGATAAPELIIDLRRIFKKHKIPKMAFLERAEYDDTNAWEEHAFENSLLRGCHLRCVRGYGRLGGRDIDGNIKRSIYFDLEKQLKVRCDGFLAFMQTMGCDWSAPSIRYTFWAYHKKLGITTEAGKIGEEKNLLKVLKSRVTMPAELIRYLTRNHATKESVQSAVVPQKRKAPRDAQADEARSMASPRDAI